VLKFPTYPSFFRKKLQGLGFSQNLMEFAKIPTLGYLNIFFIYFFKKNNMGVLKILTKLN
jgi:hypothetical protein